MKWEYDLVKDIRTFTNADDLDWDWNHQHPLGYNQLEFPEEVTDCNRQHLLQHFLKVRDKAKAILEIGIGRNDEKSFVHVLTKNKKKETLYIGLDINDRSFLRDSENNIHTIQNNSSYYQENINMFEQYWGVKEFDFIFIDGWHSINQVLEDWEYTNLLSKDGIVGFHDTTCHPGPFNFIKSLDKDKWEVIENCCPQDWGIGFARRKN